MIDKIVFLGEYPLLFDINVMEKLQEEYGSYSSWIELIEKSEEPNLKALIFGITEAINEGIDSENEKNGTNNPFVTVKKVGRILTEVGLGKATAKLKEAVVESSDVNGEESSKN